MSPAAAAPSTERATEKLFVQANTIQCALNLCRPCCYKLIIHGGKDVMPNIRPEQCPRFHTEKDGDDDDDENPYSADAETAEPEIVLRNTMVSASHKVLTLGDGNFSFSLALLKYLTDASQLVATSHEAKDTVVETYPDSAGILDALAAAGATVLHQVDATDAAGMVDVVGGAHQFDRVIWNFPCVRMPDGADGQNSEMDENKALLEAFFRAVPQVLAPGGEVHVTHKTKPPFGQWGIVALAEASGLVHAGSVVFDRCLYPGYSNKKVLSKGSFPIWDSETFVFVPKATKKTKKPVTIPATRINTDGVQHFIGWDTAAWTDKADALYPVSPELLRDIRILLGPANRKQVEAKERSRKKRKIVALPAELAEQAKKGKKARKFEKKGAPKKEKGKKTIVMTATKRNKKPKRHS
ncbi:Aste57867_11663 [Aphanomyces stellatus]|uniref:Aste57867_11663 protein n=1 Tax=Aphanomyces stellatus TaxID=120398 RepID=A0A485KUS0_9STRA|nr:hypothetical protein As57867_011620 [Aphanomyces stellatus]VFT88521.1 Aste57867_11663 [Aphanomyces stellatus]